MIKQKRNRFAYPVETFGGGTWLEPEEFTYPSGGFLRRARVRVVRNPHAPSALPAEVYGELRTVKASIPDTFFSVPARLRCRGRTVKGFVSKPYDSEELCFTPEAGEGGFV